MHLVEWVLDLAIEICPTYVVRLGVECAYTYIHVCVCVCVVMCTLQLCFWSFLFCLFLATVWLVFLFYFWEVVTTALFYVSKNPKMMSSFAGNFVDAIPPAPDG